MFYILFVLCGIFLIFSFTKAFNKLDKHVVRRTYYFIAVLWSFLFVIFNDQIIIVTSKITQNDSKLSNSYINQFILFACLVVCFIIWDFLFISCRQLNKLIIKGVELSSDESDDVIHAIQAKNENLILLEHIMDIQSAMMGNMTEYFTKIELAEDNIYGIIFEEYCKLRKNIKIKYYYFEENSINDIKQDYKLTDLQFSSILYSLNTQGVCIPDDVTEEDMVYAEINTSYTEYNLIAVITGELLYKNEYSVIQNLVSYFDKIIELEVYKAEYE